MNNFRRIIALMLAVACLASFAACGNEKEDTATTTAFNNYADKEIKEELPPDPDRGEDKIKLVAPADFSGLTFSKLAVDRSYAYTLEQKGVTSAAAAEKLKSGKAQVGVLTLEDAAKLATQTDIKIIAINTNLVLSVIAKGDAVKEGYSDLNGKTVYACGEGTYIRWITDYVFKSKGIKADIVYTTVSDIEAKMKSGEAEICILPEFEGTRLVSANTDYAKKFPLVSLWDKDFAPAATCIVARADYIAAEPEYFNELLSDVEMAANSCIDNEGGVGYMAQILTANGYFSDFELAKKSISAVGFVYLRGEEMKKTFEANIDFYADNGADVSVPAESVYYGL